MTENETGPALLSLAEELAADAARWRGLDADGRLIAAAKRVYTVVERERDVLSRCQFQTTAGLIHMVMMVWANGHIDAGRLAEDRPEFERISRDLGELSALASVGRKRQESARKPDDRGETFEGDCPPKKVGA